MPSPEEVETEVAMLMHGARPDPPKDVSASVYRHTLISASDDVDDGPGGVSPESYYKAKHHHKGGKPPAGKTPLAAAGKRMPSTTAAAASGAPRSEDGAHQMTFRICLVP